MEVDRDIALDLIFEMYANEPCRICGKNITIEQVKSDAVFAGYSQDNKSRSAHKECWDANIPKEQWIYQ